MSKPFRTPRAEPKSRPVHTAKEPPAASYSAIASKVPVASGSQMIAVPSHWGSPNHPSHDHLSKPRTWGSPIFYDILKTKKQILDPFMIFYVFDPYLGASVFRCFTVVSLGGRWKLKASGQLGHDRDLTGCRPDRMPITSQMPAGHHWWSWLDGLRLWNVCSSGYSE